jgi:uncharacterized secreted protein with C-terminal beta-propeller domain
MRAVSRVALGGSLLTTGTAAALVAGGLVVGTVATTATLVLTDPLAPAASADSLRRFDSCAALLRWYVDHGVKEVGPYGWNGPAVYYATDLAGGVPVAPEARSGTATDGAGSATDARSASGTGTNTQEADVDEPDVAKTDGRRVVRLVDQRVVAVSDVTGSEPRELGRISLPVDTYGGELLLAGDHVLVSQAAGRWIGGPGPVPMEGAAPGKVMAPAGGTRIIDVDISDAAHPRIVHDDTYTGRQVSMRLYGDTVRLVTAADRPELPWAMPGPMPAPMPGTMPGTTRSPQVSEDEATRHNRALVRATTIDDWLPAVVDNSTGGHTRLLDCQDVYHPAAWAGGETTTVTTYDVRDPAHRQSVGVTADGQVVYSSKDRLYVASSRVDLVGPWRRMGDSVPGPEMMPVRPQEVHTQLHAFALDGARTTYVGSGHVAGSVRDRWSLDEHAGRLRVAWTTSDRDGRTGNGITVLAERDGALVPTGGIDRLGLDENIQSVRWFDDLAVLVTFRQMDPLYTVDLTDQDHPRELGQLKVPGYSGYLHPIGSDLLLGLGVDATDQGQSLGAQAAVFDVADLTHPTRVAQQGFGEQSSLPALDDPRGFTWLPDRRTALTTVASWTSDRARLVALHVSDAGALEAHDLATDVGANARTLPLDDGRVALVDEGLRVLDVN